MTVTPADQTPMHPHDVQPDELDIAIAIDRMQGALDIEVRRVERSWAGLRTFASDGVPVVGPDSSVDGFFWLAGQGGYGIKTSPALSRACASLLRGGHLPEDLLQLGISAGDLSPQRLGGRARCTRRAWRKNWRSGVSWCLAALASCAPWGCC